MRTTLNLNQSIVEQVMQLTGQTNRSEAIRIALQAYIQQQQKQALLALRGELDMTDSWQTLRELDAPE